MMHTATATATPRTCGDLQGDMNCDCQLTCFDIELVVQVIFSPSDYAHNYPSCNRLHGDLTGDGIVSYLDALLFCDMIPGCCQPESPP